MTGRPEYGKEWSTERGLPACSRLRLGLTTERGTPSRFVVQLEYWHAGAWLQVARFDHDRDDPAYRNVEISGRHLDIYHPNGEQVMKDESWAPEPADDAMGKAEDFLRANADQLVRRFEQWL